LYAKNPSQENLTIYEVTKGNYLSHIHENPPAHQRAAGSKAADAFTDSKHGNPKAPTKGGRKPKPLTTVKPEPPETGAKPASGSAVGKARDMNDLSSHGYFPLLRVAGAEAPPRRPENEQDAKASGADHPPPPNLPAAPPGGDGVRGLNAEEHAVWKVVVRVTASLSPWENEKAVFSLKDPSDQTTGIPSGSSDISKYLYDYNMDGRVVSAIQEAVEYLKKIKFAYSERLLFGVSNPGSIANTDFVMLARATALYNRSVLSSQTARTHAGTALEAVRAKFANGCKGSLADCTRGCVVPENGSSVENS
jgi:hypothetical protein